jgi:penicillin-binding protein 2
MYDKRVKIFIAISVALLLACVLRLAQMQLLADSSIQDAIAQMKRQEGRSRQLKTVRGRILDRNGEPLAVDVPQFQLCVSYRLTSFLDDRVVEARRLEAVARDDNPSLFDFYNELDTKRNQIESIIMPVCEKLGAPRDDVEARIKTINDRMWGLRAFQAWRNGLHDANLPKEYGGYASVPLSKAMADFEQRVPDAQKRLRRIAAVDNLREMDAPVPLLELKTEDDIFAAQVECRDIENVSILAAGHRSYPYGSVAAQTIGWVGGASQEELFENDRLADYLEGEVCGREDGVEYVCESVLRGRRGELVYDIDRELVGRTETEFGEDVILSLDMQLQRAIQESLTDPEFNPRYYDANMAAVVIEVGSGDILALVSVPTYDLNLVQNKYGEFVNDKKKPMINRAINKQYPPGSSVKPIILIAGMESGLVTAEEEIECPSHAAPEGWPDCLIWRSSRVGHSSQWTNNARNALKGSCNIYFSRLASRFDPLVLQRWLFRFGYGRPLPLACPVPLPDGQETRELRQAPGQISSTRPTTRRIESFDDIPPLRRSDEANAGIGQGNLWATPLQVANAFATIARDGLHKPPRLFLQPRATNAGRPDMSADLGISAHTLATVREGMNAVVNERGGTAYNAFAPARLSRYDVHIYGKTGSTQAPEDAWFAGFAEDSRGRKIAVAVVVEGGQSGSHDAAPLGRDIIKLCIQAGYIGHAAASPQ